MKAEGRIPVVLRNMALVQQPPPLSSALSYTMMQEIVFGKMFVFAFCFGN